MLITGLNDQGLKYKSLIVYFGYLWKKMKTQMCKNL